MSKVQNFLHPARAFAAAGLVFMLGAMPGAARDYVLQCPDFAEYRDTATVVVHPRQIGLLASASDADVFTDEFEVRFTYKVTVRRFDDNKPSGTDAVLCSFSGSFEHEWDIPDIRTGFVPYFLQDIIYIKNTPRYSVVQVEIEAKEIDDITDDPIDFSYLPQQWAAKFDIFVNSMRARSIKGGLEGHDDITLNKVKRLVGDGHPAAPYVPTYQAYLEFTVNVHPDPAKWTSNPILPGPAQGIPGVAIPAKPTPNDHPVCRDYAYNSVAQNQEQLKLGCGFKPPVWSNDHQAHFEWCITGNNAQTIILHLAGRKAALDACRATKDKG